MCKTLQSEILQFSAANLWALASSRTRSNPPARPRSVADALDEVNSTKAHTDLPAGYDCDCQVRGAQTGRSASFQPVNSRGLERPRRRPSTRDRRDPRSRTTARWAIQRAIGLARVVLAQATPTLRMDGTSARKVCGRRATHSSRPWQRTGRRERALPAVQECLIAESLRTSDRTRASTSSFPTRRFASWKKKRPPGLSDTPVQGATRRICWQAKQVKGGDGGRLVNSLVPAPVHPAWGKGFYRGGFCRHLWNILEDKPGEDRSSRLLLTLAFRSYATAGATQRLAAGGRQCGALTSVPAR